VVAAIQAQWIPAGPLRPLRPPVRFQWRRPHATGNRDGKVFHGPCMAYQHWRAKADERLAVLAIAMDLSGMTDRDVQTAVEFRAAGHDERVTASNRAFRETEETK
jgi:hypothetical protein